MSSADCVKIHKENGVMTITLNRPEAGNAIDLAMAQALMQASIVADQDSSVRCVLLTASERFFCVGGDVGAFAQSIDQLPSLLTELTSYLNPAVSRLLRMNKPLVVAVNGAAAGAGLSLSVLGDIVIAAKSAHFTPAYSMVGLSPDVGATWILPRLMGLRQAQDFIFNNRRLSADDALKQGLVTEVVEDAGLQTRAVAIAEKLANSAVGALGKTRNLLFASMATSLETQLENEARAIAACGSDEGIEGVKAFTEKRKPEFYKG